MCVGIRITSPSFSSFIELKDDASRTHEHEASATVLGDVCVGVDKVSSILITTSSELWFGLEPNTRGGEGGSESSSIASSMVDPGAGVILGSKSVPSGEGDTTVSKSESTCTGNSAHGNSGLGKGFSGSTARYWSRNFDRTEFERSGGANVMVPERNPTGLVGRVALSIGFIGSVDSFADGGLDPVMLGISP